MKKAPDRQPTRVTGEHFSTYDDNDLLHAALVEIPKDCSAAVGKMSRAR